MLGFVASRPVTVLPQTFDVSQTFGVQPISQNFVRWTKVSKYVGYFRVLLVFVGLLWTVFGLGIVSDLMEYHSWYALGWIFPPLVLTALIMTALRAPGMPAWKTSPAHLRFNAWMYFQREYGYRELPRDVALIANRVIAAGYQPQVDYFYDDPFLWVRVKGRRVYLAHWD